jgi:hypothetical protein
VRKKTTTTTKTRRALRVLAAAAALLLWDLMSQAEASGDPLGKIMATRTQGPAGSTVIDLVNGEPRPVVLRGALVNGRDSDPACRLHPTGSTTDKKKRFRPVWVTERTEGQLTRGAWEQLPGDQETLLTGQGAAVMITREDLEECGPALVRLEMGLCPEEASPDSDCGTTWWSWKPDGSWDDDDDGGDGE